MKNAKTLFSPLSLAAFAGMALTFAQPAVADDSADEPAEAMTKGEKRLAKLLDGREAGEPLRCIRTRPNERLRVIDGTAYVYGSGNTIYVQRTRNPEDIDDRETLVTRRFGPNQICRMDIMNTIDPVIGMFTGAVFFVDFVPYKRVDKTEEG